MPLTKVIFRENCLKNIKKMPVHNKIYRNNLLNLRLQKELKDKK